MLQCDLYILLGTIELHFRRNLFLSISSNTKKFMIKSDLSIITIRSVIVVSQISYVMEGNTNALLVSWLIWLQAPFITNFRLYKIISKLVSH